jgi:hypothetical protein
MWKNVVIVVLLGILAVELPFFGKDLLHLFGRTAELTIVLLAAGVVISLKQVAKRL